MLGADALGVRDLQSPAPPSRSWLQMKEQGSEPLKQVIQLFLNFKENCPAMRATIFSMLFQLMSSENSVQFSSVAQSRLTLCHPMGCSTPGLPVHHQLPEFTQTHGHRVHPAISSSVVPFSSCPQPLPASGSFPVSQLFS